jgi:type II secretory ATPase GspE/PulE/Tfp pilus assembly ATPase PilB-like protein
MRKLCQDCKEAYEITPEQRSSTKLKAELFYRSKGCAKCNHTGYKGRTCISEAMVINDAIQNLIYQRSSFQKIREAARQSGMQTLYESAIQKVEEGSTSLEEALAVTLGSD